MKKMHLDQASVRLQGQFAEWTRDGKLRQPVFLGLRDDKKAAEVVRES
jgi:bifunctional non-homologous end joining protein LigD